MAAISSVVSLSLALGGIAAKSASLRVTARYSGLSAALPGTTAGLPLSPPLRVPAREFRSSPLLRSLGSSPWQARHLVLKIGWTFKANAVSAAVGESPAESVAVMKSRPIAEKCLRVTRLLHPGPPAEGRGDPEVQPRAGRGYDCEV